MLSPSWLSQISNSFRPAYLLRRAGTVRRVTSLAPSDILASAAGTDTPATASTSHSPIAGASDTTVVWSF